MVWQFMSLLVMIGLLVGFYMLLFTGLEDDIKGQRDRRVKLLDKETDIKRKVANKEDAWFATISYPLAGVKEVRRSGMNSGRVEGHVEVVWRVEGLGHTLDTFDLQRSILSLSS